MVCEKKGVVAGKNNNIYVTEQIYVQHDATVDTYIRLKCLMRIRGDGN